MPISSTLGDLHDICQGAIDEAATAHPDCTFELLCGGDTIGDFDGARLSQVLSNLLNNAAQYRSDQKPVTLKASSNKTEWNITVTNFGREIPREFQRAIFDPLVQLSVSADQKGPATTSLGLGLFIAREITVAHGGLISVESSKKMVRYSPFRYRAHLIQGSKAAGSPSLRDWEQILTSGQAVQTTITDEP